MAMGTTPVSISFEGVSKRYATRKHKGFLVRDAISTLTLKTIPVHEQWALRNISFRIDQGESLAFIGSNGSGKSTLLSLVAGTTHPTAGKVGVSGRIGALLELGAGFHPDLTGRENIYLNASLQGLHRDYIASACRQIIEFSELADVIDLPLRTYSSGMAIRLGFSVAIHGQPDIMIIDEALTVGDNHFQRKGLEHIRKLHREGMTLLLVSHDAGAIQAICQRAIWLHHGEVMGDGSPGEIIPAYEKQVASLPASFGPWAGAHPLGNGWCHSPWFSAFKAESYPWIYHECHGWLSLVSTENNTFMFFDSAMNRVWSTNPRDYPNIFVYGDDGGWRYYEPGSKTPRRFFNQKKGTWERIVSAERND